MKLDKIKYDYVNAKYLKFNVLKKYIKDISYRFINDDLFHLVECYYCTGI